MSIYVTGGAEHDDEIDALRSRLAEAEAILRWVRVNLPNVGGMGKRIDAFLAPDSASDYEDEELARLCRQSASDQPPVCARCKSPNHHVSDCDA